MKGIWIVEADGDDTTDRAIAWHLRLREAETGDWADFIDWLEADPAHAAAYDRIARQDRLIVPDRFAAPAAVNDNPPHIGRWRGWRWIAGGSVAAALAAVLALVVMPGWRTARAPYAPAPYEIATRPGQTRTLALGDGTRIAISGGTRLRLDRADPRAVALEQGEATFAVRHDDTRPFAITAGKTTIRDLGTVFDVAREGGRVTVAVASGSVMVGPGRAPITLRSGDTLAADERTGRVSLGRIAPDMADGWRSGMVRFDGEPLAQVAARLNRLYATDLTMEGGLSARPFTGMVRFTGTAERDVPHLAALIGAKWRRDANRWVLSDGTPDTR